VWNNSTRLSMKSTPDNRMGWLISQRGSMFGGRARWVQSLAENACNDETGTGKWHAVRGQRCHGASLQCPK
jgi:hypothetical protein